jgi:hypothetical protein
MVEGEEIQRKAAAPEPTPEVENKPAEPSSLRNTVDNFKPQDVRAAMRAMGQLSNSDSGAVAGVPDVSIKFDNNDSTNQSNSEVSKVPERTWMDPKKWFDAAGAGRDFVPPDSSMMNQAREAITNTVLKLGVTDQSLVLYDQKSGQR